ncbi:MAG TPA: carbon-nitrogen hydrolase family protein [Actinomycetota bacterium]|nr:carbon-nitrogen hydrolase family protein [Actinomycetota bacterium]
MSRPLPITAVQAAPVAYDVTATSQKFETELTALKASFPRTRLFVFPELYLSAIHGMATTPPKGYDASVAEPIPGPLTDRLCKLAEKLDVWLVPGSIYEKGDGGELYNTALAISPSGDIVAKYRKIFPWQPWEQTSHGNEFVVFDLEDIGRAGLMICYDGWFPEVSRHLAWKGAEVILQPTATATADRDQELVLARANAIVNQVYVVNPNMGGRPGPGRSIIVDPEGRALQVGGDGEEYLTEVLDLDNVRKVREFGSVGLNRMWDQLDREGPEIDLPMYGGSFQPRPKPPG